MMVQILVVIPVGLKAAVESASATLSPGSVGNAFTIPLSASGEDPVTHWATQPNVSEGALAQIQQLLQSASFQDARLFVAESSQDHLPMISRGLQILGLSVVCHE